MALPKRRTSKARVRERRAGQKARTMATVICPQCQSVKLAHHVCRVCGTYKGRQVIEVKPTKKAA